MNTLFLLIIFAQTILILSLVYLMLQSFNKTNKESLVAIALQLEKKQIDAKITKTSEGLSQILPLKIQASERLVLFLERIQPSALLARNYLQETTASELNKLILNAIREEFEHNLSQQLFISETAWRLTKAAREEVVQVFHLALSNLAEDATSLDLARELVGAEVKLIEPAIQKLREDLNTYI